MKIIGKKRDFYKILIIFCNFSFKISVWFYIVQKEMKRQGVVVEHMTWCICTGTDDQNKIKKKKLKRA